MQHWGTAAEWRVEPATGDPTQPVSPSGWVLHDTLAARLSPRGGLAALAAALRGKGVEILADAPDTGMVVHATGAAGLHALSAAFGRKLGSGVKGQAALLRPDILPAAQIYASGLHLVPHANGTLAVGSTTETTWQTEGPDAQLDLLIERARALLPCLATAPVVERWAGLRPRAASRQLLLGAWPGRNGHFIANGGFKIGFGMAPKAAFRLVDLVLTGCNAIPAQFLPESLL